MSIYCVRSKFRDARGKELFQRKTFHGEAADAREALVEAHAEMAKLGAEDARVDSISSIVKGPNEEISTTDYLDELGTGVSSSGLMEEVDADVLDTMHAKVLDRRVETGEPFEEWMEMRRDIQRNYKSDELGEGFAQGGIINPGPGFNLGRGIIHTAPINEDGTITKEAEADAGIFPGPRRGSDIGSPGARDRVVPDPTQPVFTEYPWYNPQAHVSADIFRAKQKIAEHPSLGITPGEYHYPHLDDTFIIGEVDPIDPDRVRKIRQALQIGIPGGKGPVKFAESALGFPMTAAQKDMLSEAYSRWGRNHLFEEYIGIWPKEKETDNES